MRGNKYLLHPLGAWSCLAGEIKFSVVVPVGNKMDWEIKQHSSTDDEKHESCYVLCMFSISVQDKKL
jgi:hypothetical protein